MDRESIKLKSVPGYEEYLSVSKCGKVFSHRKKRFLKGTDFQGYRKIFLAADGKTDNLLVHRLVLLTYRPIENPELYHADHINSNRSDNRLENLQWLDIAEHQEKTSSCDKVSAAMRGSRISTNRMDRRIYRMQRPDGTLFLGFRWELGNSFSRQLSRPRKIGSKILGWTYWGILDHEEAKSFVFYSWFNPHISLELLKMQAALIIFSVENLPTII